MKDRTVYTIHPVVKDHRFIRVKKESSKGYSIGRPLGTKRFIDEVASRLSQELTNRFMNWTANHLAASWEFIGNDGEISSMDINWGEFNEEGLYIAKEMRKKFGKSVIIQYMRSEIDPSFDGKPIVIE